MHEGINREIWQQQGRNVSGGKVGARVCQLLSQETSTILRKKEKVGLAVELQNYGMYWKQLSRKIKTVGE